VPLQPVTWLPDGLLCTPRVAGEVAQVALAHCPFPTTAVAVTTQWPDSEAAMVSGWYRRTDRHASAPPGQPELIQAPGDGFGPAGHPTTQMCLAAIPLLPDADAVDVGCGSGLLAQAWARSHTSRVLAIDLDPAAVSQTRASIVLAELTALVTTDRRPLELLSPSELAERVLFANIPPSAHRKLLQRIGAPPVAVVASGVRPHETDVIDGYRRLGLRHVRASRRGRFECHVLVRCR
jgi:ribosomal protein L11 methylase PrmA